MKAAVSAVVRIANREVAANTYICSTSAPEECILIDPGFDREAIETALDEAELTPIAIFCTHGHFDHLGSAEYFRRKYGIDIHLHGSDTKIARSSNFLMMALKLRSRVDVPTEFVSVADGTVWSSGGDHVEFVHVPGHTPGSCVVLFEGAAFTGDTLYRKDVWLGSLPETNHQQLVESVRRLWTLLPDDTMIYPGHGGVATFGEIKRSNGPLREMLGLAPGDAPGDGL
jgi:glyoxylase-like metal-dependent hydrolase (beta-lactamase superfamily II)